MDKYGVHIALQAFMNGIRICEFRCDEMLYTHEMSLTMHL